jgi:hypothetical protein
MGWLLCQLGFGYLPTYTGALVFQVFSGRIPTLETWHPPLLSKEQVLNQWFIQTTFDECHRIFSP